MPEDTCTEDCKNGVGKGRFVDEEFWHHRDCPNHTSKCCPINEED